MTTWRPVDRIHRELHVGPPGLHPDPPDAGEGRIPHGLELDVGQRLGRGHRDRIAGVDPHRIEVLDGTDDHAVVGAVPHHLQLELLLPGDRLFDQHLVDRRGVQAFGRQLDQRVAGGGDTGSGPPEDVAGPHHQGIADRISDGQRLVQGMGEARHRYGQPDLPHRRLEPVAVLGGGDGLRVGPDHFDPVLVEHAPFGQGHGQIEGGLPAQGGEQGIGAFAFDDGAQHVGIEGLDIGAVRHGRIGHDGRRIRVGQHHPELFLGQHPAGLGARVVELAGLADDDGTRSDDQDRLDVGAPGHQARPPPPVDSISIRNSSNR